METEKTNEHLVGVNDQALDFLEKLLMEDGKVPALVLLVVSPTCNQIIHNCGEEAVNSIITNVYNNAIKK